jgi:hypothetical protein
VACKGERRNAYSILVGKPERMRQLGRRRRRWEDNIRVDPREIVLRNLKGRDHSEDLGEDEG